MSLNEPELHQLGKRENDRNAPEVTAGEPCSAEVRAYLASLRRCCDAFSRKDVFGESSWHHGASK